MNAKPYTAEDLEELKRLQDVASGPWGDDVVPRLLATVGALSVPTPEDVERAHARVLKTLESEGQATEDCCDRCHYRALDTEAVDALARLRDGAARAQALEADNSALLAFLRDAHAAMTQVSDEHVPQGFDDTQGNISIALSAPHPGVALLERLSAAESERDAYRQDFQGELDGAESLRQRFGARDSETFPTFVERLASERAAARQEVETLKEQLGYKVARIHELYAESQQARSEAASVNAQLEEAKRGHALFMAERDAARQEVTRWEETEARLCPEDVGFEECITSLRTRVATLEREVQQAHASEAGASERERKAVEWADACEAERDNAASECAAWKAQTTKAEAELTSLRASMHPTRLETPDPTTLEEALAALRRWRGGARDANRRALENYRRAEASERRVRNAADRLTGIAKGADKIDPLELETAVEAVERELAETRKRLEAAASLCERREREHLASAKAAATEGTRTAYRYAAGEAKVLAAYLRETVATLEALAERRRQDRADALNVKTTDGLSAAEWVARAGKAERALAETRKRLEAVEAHSRQQAQRCEGLARQCREAEQRVSDLNETLERKQMAIHGLMETAAEDHTSPAPAPLVEAVGPLVDALRGYQPDTASGLFYARNGEPGPEVLDATGVARLLAAHDAAKGGETVPLTQDVATVKEALDALAEAAPKPWHTEVARAAGIALERIAKAMDSEPSISHAALAAVVEEVAKSAQGDAEYQRSQGNREGVLAFISEEAGARKVLSRVTGGQVPEVLPKAHVVEVLARRHAQAREAAQRARDMGLPGRRHHSGARDMAQAIAQDLNLTLDTPPSGPGGGVEP